MKTLPSNLKKYNQTPSYNQNNIPKAMLDIHNTKKGVWGLIVVEQGSLAYEIIQSHEKHILNQKNYGVVEPQIKHRIRAQGDVQFHIEFYKYQA